MPKLDFTVLDHAVRIRFEQSSRTLGVRRAVYLVTARREVCNDQVVKARRRARVARVV